MNQPNDILATVATLADERLAYVPPKLERLDTSETQASPIPNAGSDGLFIYS